MKARITKKAGERWNRGRGHRLRSSAREEEVSYIIKTRIHGRQKLITTGKHGTPWTPETAPKKALKILADTTRGIDPNKRKGPVLGVGFVARNCTVSERLMTYCRAGNNFFNENRTCWVEMDPSTPICDLDGAVRTP